MIRCLVSQGHFHISLEREPPSFILFSSFFAVSGFIFFFAYINFVVSASCLLFPWQEGCDLCLVPLFYFLFSSPWTIRGRLDCLRSFLSSYLLAYIIASRSRVSRSRPVCQSQSSSSLRRNWSRLPVDHHSPTPASGSGPPRLQHQVLCHRCYFCLLSVMEVDRPTLIPVPECSNVLRLKGAHHLHGAT